MKSIREQNTGQSPRILHTASQPGSSEILSYHMGGELGFRFGWSLHRITNQLPYSREYILSQISGERGTWTNFPRVHGDIAGRWILAETTAWSASQVPPAFLRQVVASAIGMQNTDGSFGCITHEQNPLNMHKLYGNGWMLRGLTQYARVFSDKNALTAALHLADYYLRVFPLWAGMDLPERDTGFYAITRSCYFHALDAIVDLYRLTGRNDLLTLAGNFIPYLTPLEQSDHSHMYLTIRRGLLEYYEETGNEEGLTSLAQEMELVWDTRILESAGVPERFGIPEPGERVYDEGCSLFDWIMICLKLSRLTGETRWMDRAILVLENHIYYNQAYNGGFGSCELGSSYLQYGKEAPWCCSLYGSWALARLGSCFVERQAHTVTIHHPVTGTWQFTDGSSLTMTVDHEQHQLLVDTAGHEITEIRLYMPHWVENGQGADFTCFPLTPGTMKIDLPFRLWCACPDTAPEEAIPTEGREVNLFYGPYLLTHRFHRPPSVDLSREPVIDWIKGTTSYGEGFRITMHADIEKSPYDVFLGVEEQDGDLYLYPLKDKESPDASSTEVIVGYQGR